LGEDIDMVQVERALQVSFWCIQEQPTQRPSMGKVVQMLEGSWTSRGRRRPSRRTAS
ncbi:hypothetical protein BAE44_0004174, partial [Dichanthelium oligosanthes]